MPDVAVAPPSQGSRVVLGVAALIVIAGARSFAALSTSIWFDESVSVRDVSGSFGQMLHRVVNHEASPPFYFVFLWVWRHLVGSTAVDLEPCLRSRDDHDRARLPCRPRRIGQRAALILGACVAVSPVLVYYSTEMRMYALLVLLTGIGFEAFLRASESPNRQQPEHLGRSVDSRSSTQYYAALAVRQRQLLLGVLAWQGGRGAAERCSLSEGSPRRSSRWPQLMLYQAGHSFAYGRILLASRWQRIPLSIHVATVGEHRPRAHRGTRRTGGCAPHAVDLPRRDRHGDPRAPLPEHGQRRQVIRASACSRPRPGRLRRDPRPHL